MFRVICSSTVLTLCISAAAAAQAPLTLAEAIDRALREQPMLDAARLQVDARSAEVGQARRWLNPTASMETEDFGRAGESTGPAETTVGLSQRFELGGKRAQRTAVAIADRVQAEGDLLVARHTLEGRVAAAYVRVSVAEAEVLLADEDAATAAEVAAAIAARVEAGVAAPPDGDRAQTAALGSVIRQREAVARLLSARAALAATWAGGPADVGALGPGVPAPVAVPPLEGLIAAIDAAPVVALEQAGVSRAQASIALARSARVPDLDVSVGYRRLHELPSNAWVVGVETSLPLFDRQQEREAAAALRASAASRQVEGVRAAVRAALVTAHQAATHAAATASSYDTELIPLHERVYDAVSEGYAAGRFGLLQLLDARQSLIDARRTRLRALEDLYRNLITIHATLGRSAALADLTLAGGAR